ncbi:hypothetical protein [Streptococcus sp. S784/96/1]|uniref:hypothetical protein n=1 Tax=Streptococcus sp. S784/96/1 TaxID=2653499 RepID=UPI001386A6EB|nr:hypothetical protein [Streptococcus sp. S784/96/1]
MTEITQQANTLRLQTPRYGQLNLSNKFDQLVVSVGLLTSGFGSLGLDEGVTLLRYSQEVI